MEFRTLFYSAARRGAHVPGSNAVQESLTSAIGLLMPGSGFRIGRSDDKQVEVFDPRDSDRSVYSTFGWMDGYQTFYPSVSPDLTASVDAHTLRAFLTQISRSLDVDVGRTHVDPDSHALWPDEWGGKVNGVGWYQYFGPRVAPGLKATTAAASGLFTVDRHDDGGLSLTLSSGPLEDPSWEAVESVAEALGISLREG